MIQLFATIAIITAAVVGFALVVVAYGWRRKAITESAKNTRQDIADNVAAIRKETAAQTDDEAWNELENNLRR